MSDTGTGGPPEGRAGDAMGHLQAAAREMIEAARAFLDVAEEVVDDPKAGEALLGALGAFARRVQGDGPGGPDGDHDGGVEHIRVD